MKRLIFLVLLLILFIPDSLYSQDTSDTSLNRNVTSLVNDSIPGSDTVSVAGEPGIGESQKSTGHQSILLTDESVHKGFNLAALLRGFIGMLFLIFVSWLFSTNRKAISWRVVITGLAIQILLAIGVLEVHFVQVFFEFCGKVFVKIVDFTLEGSKFLFKAISTGEIEEPLVNFAITILPTVIFFSALTSVLFYYGIIQKVVYGMAWVMTRLLKLSGAESLSVAGNIFPRWKHVG